MDTSTPTGVHAPVHHLFRQAARQWPARIAVDWEDGRLTYAELAAEADALVARLRGAGAGTGSQVAILAGLAPEVAAAILAVLEVGGIFVPLDPTFPIATAANVLREVTPPLWLVGTGQEESFARLAGEHALAATAIHLGDRPAAAPAGAGQPAAADAVDPDAPCYLFFTSGSTGRPKGIVGRLCAIDHFVRWEIEAFGVTAGTRVSQLTSPSFDACLRDFFVPLAAGGTVCAPARRDTVLSGERLGAWLERAEVNLLHCTPSVFRSLLGQPLEGGRFPALRRVLLAGEPLLPGDVRRWRAAFGDRIALVNGYGPSETTMLKLFHFVGPDDAEAASVPIGKPMPGARAIVIDDRGRPCSPGRMGEIYIRTRYRSHGYLGQPEVTGEAFIRNPWGGGPDDIVYKTGDLGRMREDGSFEFVRRRDQQVKLRGMRVELAPIEELLREHEAVAEAAVAPQSDVQGNNFLCAYVVLREEIAPARLADALRGRLPEAMVPSLFVPLARLPRTISGKIDRDALPDPGAAAAPAPARHVPPRDAVERRLCEIFAEVLGRAPIGIHDNFFELGGHSLLATLLLSRIRAAFGVEVPLHRVFQEPTVAQLAPAVAGAPAAPETAAATIPAGPPDASAPLSFAQARLWFLHMLDPASPAYNIPAGVRLSGDLDVAALRAALAEIVRRHAVLRSVVLAGADEPVQAPQDHGAFQLPYVDLGGLGEAAAAEAERLAEADARRGFDLAAGPLLRPLLVRVGPSESAAPQSRAGDRHHLLATMHHIATDGWSMGILVDELAALYDAFRARRPSPLPELPVSYADYARWQRGPASQPELEQELAYWRETLRDLPPPLALPADFPRPAALSGRGARRPVRLDPALVSDLQALAQRAGATLFMVLTAGFATALARFSGQGDFCLGTPVAGRTRPELERLIGCFVNTLVLRTRTVPAETAAGLLERVRATALGAFAHQQLAFERLVDELIPERTLSRSPLVQALLVLHNAPLPPFELPDLRLEAFERYAGTAKFDLSLSLIATAAGGLTGPLEYSTDLFAAATMDRLAGAFATLLREMCAAPERRLDELAHLGAAERQQLIREWNATGRAYAGPWRLDTLIAAQARRTPGAVAVEDEAGALTYGDLLARADRLAGRLAAAGVAADQPVAVCIESSTALVVGLLAVLRASGAYLPLDPGHPRHRLAALLADSGARVVIASAATAGLFAAGEAAVVLVPPGGDAAAPDAALPAAAGPEEALAYVLYTSGTTGLPKGVMISHRAIANHMLWMQERFPLGPGDAVLQKTPPTFDASVWELFAPLIAGARLVMARPGGYLDPAYLAETIAEQRVTVLQLVPSLLGVFLEEAAEARCAGLRRLFCGGEALAPTLRDAALATLGGELCNLYGPTECAIDTLFWVFRRGAEQAAVPIGRPIANARVYLLDGAGQPVPLGAPGELYVGGAGLARGYLGRPAQTAERFLPDPWSGEPGARLYRSGDLARHLPDGAIEFLGRVDAQVKIRGLRVEPSEIEAALAAHPAVAEAAVVVQGEGSRQRLVAFVVPASDPSETADAAALRRFMEGRLPAPLVPAAFVMIAELPRAAGGKLDRKALAARPVPAAEDGAARRPAPPATPVERLLAGIWRELLGLAPEEVGLHDSFFALGGDSILSIQMVSRAARAGWVLTPRQVFEHQTIAELAAVAVPAAPRAVAAAPSGAGPFPVTPIQRWFLDQRRADPHHFNQAVLLAPGAALTPALAAWALAVLAEHHKALRLRCREEGGRWVQWCAADGPGLPLTHVDLAALGAAAGPALVGAVAGEVQAALDFERGPVGRAVWLSLAGGEARLLLVLHHMAVDGVSWRILLEDFDAACRQLAAGAPVALPATPGFRVWAESLAARVAAAPAEEELAWWRRETAPGTARLPLDFPDGENLERSQRAVTVTLTAEETEALLRQVPQAYRTRIEEVLLTALALALDAGAAGDRAVLVDLEGHGREEVLGLPDCSRTVGWFTSLYPVRLGPEVAAGGAGPALRHIKEHLRAVPARGLGYGLLRWGGGADLGTREAEIVFNYLGQLDAALPAAALFSLAEEPVGAPRSPRSRRSHLLGLRALIVAGRLQVDWQYSTALHRPATVEGWAHAFLGKLRGLIAHCLSAEAGGLTPSDVPLAGLDQAALDALFGTRRDVEDVYPLSPVQEGMLFHSLLAAEAPVYVAQVSCSLLGELDPAAVETAWRQVVARHGVLRTAFAWQGRERPLQVLLREVPVEIERLDWRDVPADSLELLLAELQRTKRRRGFDLAAAPLAHWTLVQTGEREHRFLWTFHHVLLDGWSSAAVFAEVLAAYAALQGAPEHRLPPPLPFRDYVAWLLGKDWAEAEGYWRRTLAGWRSPLHLARGAAAAAAEEREMLRERRTALSEAVSDGLRALARRQRVTLATVIEGAWALLVGRSTGEEDVVFGNVVSGRAAPLSGMETAVGLFINTLPARIALPPRQALGAWLDELQRRLAEMRNHEATPLGLIQGWSELEKRTPLFDNVFAFENYPVEEALPERVTQGLRLESIQTWGQTNYPLIALVLPRQRLELKLRFAPPAVDPVEAERLLQRLEVLLAGMAAADGERPLESLPLLAPAERAQLLVEWNDTAGEAPADLLARLEAQAARTPDADAVVFEQERLTYRQLHARADLLAHRLRTAGVGLEQPVALAVDRSAAMIVALLGILKAGAAYLPVDLNDAAGRQAQMLADSGVRTVVTEERWRPLFARPELTAVVLGDAAGPEPPALPAPPLPAGRLAYLIFTSGSTGRPKGVMVEQRHLAAYLDGVIARLALPPGASYAMVQPLTFDSCATTIYPPLLSGGCLHVLAHARLTNSDALADYAAREPYDYLKIVPSHLAALLEGSSPERVLPRRLLIVGGEACPAPLLEQIARLAPGLRVLGHYGPTETTVGVTTLDVPLPPAGWSSAVLALGRPLRGVRTVVLDRRGRPVPAGVTGELHVGGALVTRGYIGRPELTAALFVPDPFSAQLGGRLYRTGDLVRQRADGVIEFLGRADSQVKIRGHRVEPGEVAAVLRRHPEVRDAVVVAVGEGGARQLAAYVVPADGTEAAAEELRRHLRAHLPEYMIPAAFLSLSELPRTAHGKLDAKALPSPAAGQRPAREYVAPRTATERALAEIWSEVLGVEQIGALDDFFEIGGHSLAAVRVAARIWTRLEVQVALPDLFAHPTLAALATRVEDAMLAALASLDGGSLDEVLAEAGLAEGEASMGYEVDPRWPDNVPGGEA